MHNVLMELSPDQLISGVENGIPSHVCACQDLSTINVERKSLIHSWLNEWQVGSLAFSDVHIQ